MQIKNIQVDYLDELGEVALGSRLKRLSDRVMSDASRIYKFTGHDMQPKWFTLMSLLFDKKSVAVVQAAEYLGLSQPCISQFRREMAQVGLLQVTSDKDDLRRKILSLTKKGIKKYKQMQPVRDSVRCAAVSICQEDKQDFFQALKKFEKALERKSLYQRTLDTYKGKK